MTIGSVQIAAWAAWLTLILACCGLWAVCWQGCELVLWARDWRRDRKEPARRELDSPCGICGSMLTCEHDETPDGCDLWGREPGDEGYGLAPLPPERSREELGFTGEQPDIAWPWITRLHDLARKSADEGTTRYIDDLLDSPLAAERERRPSWWEAEHRAAYESLGFDYPSGLLARVREMTP